MIINLLFNLLILVFGWVFSVLPIVTVSSIPLIGEFVSTYLGVAMRAWNTFMETLPYARIGWDVFVTVILPFEGLLLLSKFILGSRMPANHK